MLLVSHAACIPVSTLWNILHLNPHLPPLLTTPAFICISSFFRQIEDYTEPVADSFKEYMPRLRRVADRSPAFQYILPLAEALSHSAKPPLPASDTGLLRGPLHRVGMRCGLPSCGARNKVWAPDRCSDCLFFHVDGSD